ncbi:PLP-dependent transferase [Sistotremastrum niveocremeum HHB9708]|uniref:cystathionine gamma-synthase n=2 Tax=Sistotremastraceae TaxID=3402574 RepID=A0A164N211_9AGAM|nr:PLP-dependent transferase [Sistotremastrum niveocremeum HHB9708]KZT37482.1 PLP-dependent transferase [Sistotremastrum suecicum HHB10207 ss-3]
MSILGASIPAIPHAISVSLPTWRDNIDYEEGNKRVIDTMCTGYPRFFIHKSIQKLATICESKFGRPGESCMLFPKARIANACLSFMLAHHKEPHPLPIRTVNYLIPLDSSPNLDSAETPSSSAAENMDLHMVFFPAESFPLAKQFWQHTGLGISSRFADKCLSLVAPEVPTITPSPSRAFSKPGNRHYSKKSTPNNPLARLHGWSEPSENLDQTYLEERYGRNLPAMSADIAKRTLRRRIAGVLVRDPYDSLRPGEGCSEQTGPSVRGIENVSEDDVFLYPSGMSAIWNAHQLALSVMPSAKSVCFGFPYTDTLKILQKWGPGCHFFGHGTDADADALEAMLEAAPVDSPPVLALFCEFPSNPLLRSPPLKRLKDLAAKYKFLIVIDETVGNFANVEVLPFADMVVSGLTKVFSGDANVMGGSMILNPASVYYEKLKKALTSCYDECYWGEDAVFLERNSRDFARRVHVIDGNAEAVCDWLRERSLEVSPDSGSVVKKIWYPKFVTPEYYDVCRVKGSADRHPGGYGGLFSVTFTSLEASQAFFDTLDCCKGPSLGTNFTLACPYTILAHYAELDWAASYGVEPGLVRVSVGMEKRDTLLTMFAAALGAAQATAKL